MENVIILVDNSNIFIEGSKHSAFLKGAQRNSEGRMPNDPSWRLNFSGLIGVLAEGRPIVGAILVGSRPPPNDDVWKAAEAGGFSVVTHDRDARGKEKAVDTELVAMGTELICTSKPPGVVVIASGDRDFIPLVKVAQRQGWRIEMAAFESAFSKTGEMATAVNKVRSLDRVIDDIGRCDFEWTPAPVDVGK